MPMPPPPPKPRRGVAHMQKPTRARHWADNDDDDDDDDDNNNQVFPSIEEPLQNSYSTSNPFQQGHQQYPQYFQAELQVGYPTGAVHIGAFGGAGRIQEPGQFEQSQQIPTKGAYPHQTAAGAFLVEGDTADPYTADDAPTDSLQQQLFPDFFPGAHPRNINTNASYHLPPPVQGPASYPPQIARQQPPQTPSRFHNLARKEPRTPSQPSSKGSEGATSQRSKRSQASLTTHIHRHQEALLTAPVEDPDIPMSAPAPNARNLRACMVCSIVRTAQDFKRSGCPNCEQFLELAGNDDGILECTSQVFDGMIAISDTSGKSWVVRHQRLDGYVAGVYATQVEGVLPEDIALAVENAGVQYIPRDGSSNEVLVDGE